MLLILGLLAQLVCPALAQTAPCFHELSDISVTQAAGLLYQISANISNPQFNRVQPPFVVLPRTPSHVQRALTCAFQQNVSVAVKAGGHGFGGYSAVGNIAAFSIAFTNMTSISPIFAFTLPSGEAVPAVRVGAGVRWGDLYARLNTTRYNGSSLTAVGGLCPSVGIAGHVQGGGVGALSRTYGLASDNVLAFTLVSANGSAVVQVDGCSNEDLYWAVRGAGGGNFGVITDITLRLHPSSPAYTFTLLCYECSRVGAVLRTAAGMADALPRGVNVDLVIEPNSTQGSNDCGVCVWSIALGNASYSNASLAPLLALGPLSASQQQQGEGAARPRQAYRGLRGQSSVTTYSTFWDMSSAYALAHGYSEFSDVAYASKNCLVPSSLLATAQGAAQMAQVTSQLLAMSPPACDLHWIQFGGSLSDLPANASSFPWRGAAYMLYAACSFDSAPSYTVSDAYLVKFWGVVTNATGLCQGAYVNFIDPWQQGEGWGALYYGPPNATNSTIERLLRIKQQWAPVGATPLRFAQEIGPRAVPVS